MTMRKRLAIVGVIGVVGLGAAILAFGGRPELQTSVEPGCAPIQGATGPLPGMPCTRRATLVGENPGYLAPGGAADGTLLGSARWGIDNDQDSRLPVALLGDSTIAAGVPWARIYVPSHLGSGDNDLFTWVPLAIEGDLRVIDIRPPECPPTRDNLSTLGALDPITLARCLGTGQFKVTGTTRGPVGPVAYDVTPEWLSGWQHQGTSFSIRDAPFGEPIDIQVRDGNNLPPQDFTIELTAHVADRAAGGCTRTPIHEHYPAEAREDSILWCSTRVVADDWRAVLGPEGRPIDPANPQLHRHEPLTVCAGVNMGLLRFRLDANELDPVWLERRGGGRVMPSFTEEFRPAFQPDLVIVDRTGGVVVRDGLEINPDANLAGHFTCGTGEWLSIG